jgi:hypothetical protein
MDGMDFWARELAFEVPLLLGCDADHLQAAGCGVRDTVEIAGDHLDDEKNES